MSAAPNPVIFDLDGTLIDSAVLCTSILNEMLRERGSDRLLTAECAKPFMSHGGAHLVSNLLGQECGDVALEVVEFRRRYAELPTPETSLFDGVRAGLERLSDLGIPLAICSNKPQHLCDKVLDELELAPLFAVVVGGATGRRPKPDPHLMELTLEGLDAAADRCLFVGDSEQDHLLAEAAGVAFRFMTYGYPAPGWSAEGLVQFGSFADLVQAIETERSGGGALRRVA